MNPCTDCASEIQRKLAAKADDQHAEAQAKEFVAENKATVALYRDEHGQLCYIRAELASGYPVVGYLSHHNLPAAS